MQNLRFTFGEVGGEAGEVRFSEFVSYLQNIRTALNGLDIHLSGHPTLYYRIVSITKSSPTKLVLEPIPIAGIAQSACCLPDQFVQTLNYLQRGERPSGFSQELVEKFTLLGKQLKGSFSYVKVASNGHVSTIDEKLVEMEEAVLGHDYMALGSVTGFLDVINVHKGQNAFWVYRSGGLPKVKCRFSEGIKAKAISSIGKFVHVLGSLKYKSKEIHPYEVIVDDLFIAADESSIPKLSSLWGSMPNILESEESTEFTERQRDEWEQEKTNSLS